MRDDLSFLCVVNELALFLTWVISCAISLATSSIWLESDSFI